MDDATNQGGIGTPGADVPTPGAPTDPVQTPPPVSVPTPAPTPAPEPTTPDQGGTPQA